MAKSPEVAQTGNESGALTAGSPQAQRLQVRTCMASCLEISPLSGASQPKIPMPGSSLSLAYQTASSRDSLMVTSTCQPDEATGPRDLVPCQSICLCEDMVRDSRGGDVVHSCTSKE